MIAVNLFGFFTRSSIFLLSSTTFTIMGCRIVFRYICNAISICIIKRLHISCDRIPGFHLFIAFHDCMIFQIFNWISVFILWLKRQKFRKTFSLQNLTSVRCTDLLQHDTAYHPQSLSFLHLLWSDSSLSLYSGSFDAGCM